MMEGGKEKKREKDKGKKEGEGERALIHFPWSHLKLTLMKNRKQNERGGEGDVKNG